MARHTNEIQELTDIITLLSSIDQTGEPTLVSVASRTAASNGVIHYWKGKVLPQVLSPAYNAKR